MYYLCQYKYIYYKCDAELTRQIIIISREEERRLFLKNIKNWWLIRYINWVPVWVEKQEKKRKRERVFIIDKIDIAKISISRSALPATSILIGSCRVARLSATILVEVDNKGVFFFFYRCEKRKGFRIVTQESRRENYKRL